VRRAVLERDDRWLQCYRWFVEVVNGLLGDLPDQLGS
jgi:hypothetical protein